MQARRIRPNMAMAMIAFTVLFGVMIACARILQVGNPEYFSVSGAGIAASTTLEAASSAPEQAGESRPLSGPNQTPTPDDPHPVPPMRTQEESYVVQANDTLASIAQRYGVSVQQLVQANAIADPDIVPLGMELVIPIPLPDNAAAAFKVIPDSELVWGPAATGFDIDAFIQSQGGYLANYWQEIDGQSYSGAQVIQRVVHEYSVNPRLLLAALEYQNGWVTRQDAPQNPDFPMGWQDSWRKGLYFQLAWAANQLNRGFYLWRVNGASSWLLADGSVVPVNPTINAGTAGVQSLFANFYGRQDWERAVGPEGLAATYSRLFGYPFDLSVEPLRPPDLQQPPMQLPFEAGREWAYTGGPHGGWADGSAWAALDFAPPGPALGCVQSDEWVVAVADGTIVRTGNGAVVQDLDMNGTPNDGFEQTGWVVFYMHVEGRDRVQPGTYVRAGERIGHPSCEGGFSTGTHLHLARKYNGEWLPADQTDLPFNLDGWVSVGEGYEYNGYLKKDGNVIVADSERTPGNGIQR